jgi:hypothetical protein
LLSSIKKNGSRACVIEGALYSKIGRKEDIKVDHLRKAVEELGDLATFDAEVYAHGLSLQRIRSAWLKPVKTQKEIAKIQKDYRNRTGKELPYNPNEDALKLKFHVFDIPKVDFTPFNDRRVEMQELNNEVISRGLTNAIEFIYPQWTYNAEDRLKLRDWAVEQGYEGLVHYEDNGVYEFGKRSRNTQKDKPRYDSEALCLGVEACKNGDGKLLLRACDALDNVEFKCMMKVTRRDGKDYPRKVADMEGLIGQWVTFSYEELSDKGKPTKPVGEEVRDCDNEGNPLN